MALVRLDGPGSASVPAPPTGAWQVMCTTEDADVTDDPMAPDVNLEQATVRFMREGAVVLASTVPPR
jgi:hypothetical protein